MPKKVDPDLIAEMPLHYVRFDCVQGRPKSIEGRVLLRKSSPDSEKILIIFEPGVTGYESYYLDSFLASVENYEFDGIWICAGTAGKWDSAYIHGLQVQVIVRELDLLSYV